MFPKCKHLGFMILLVEIVIHCKRKQTAWRNQCWAAFFFFSKQHLCQKSVSRTVLQSWHYQCCTLLVSKENVTLLPMKAYKDDKCSKNDKICNNMVKSWRPTMHDRRHTTDVGHSTITIAHFLLRWAKEGIEYSGKRRKCHHVSKVRIVWYKKCGK